jgi:hypothetical protein
MLINNFRTRVDEEAVYVKYGKQNPHALNKKFRVRNYDAYYVSLHSDASRKLYNNNSSLHKTSFLQVVTQASEQRSVVGLCEHGNEHSSSIKGGEFFD